MYKVVTLENDILRNASPSDKYLFKKFGFFFLSFCENVQDFIIVCVFEIALMKFVYVYKKKKKQFAGNATVLICGVNSKFDNF